MKAYTLLGLFLLIGSCYAYQIVKIEQYKQQQQAQIRQESLKFHAKIDARLPARSKATQGKVLPRKGEPAPFSSSLFILGGDEFSYQWLKAHAKELEEFKAIGFVTNIESSNHLHALQALTQMPLLPANVDDLMIVLHENHYPFIVHEDQLWQ
jgi:integrating conjugative element protein (TIGR03765 family)